MEGGHGESISGIKYFYTTLHHFLRISLDKQHVYNLHQNDVMWYKST